MDIDWRVDMHEMSLRDKSAEGDGGGGLAGTVGVVSICAAMMALGTVAMVRTVYGRPAFEQSARRDASAKPCPFSLLLISSSQL